MKLLASVPGVVLSLLAAAVPVSGQVRFEVLDGPGYLESTANAVSADGQIVVGWVDVDGCPRCHAVPFAWREETGIVVLDADLYGSPALALSLDGAVVVGAVLDPSDLGCDLPYIWRAGHTTVFEPCAVAYAVSDDGSVVVGGGELEAMRWTAESGWETLGRMPDTCCFGGVAMGVTPDGLQIVGSAYLEVPEPSIRAFRWTAETGMQPLGALLPGVVRKPRGQYPGTMRCAWGGSALATTPGPPAGQLRARNCWADRCNRPTAGPWARTPMGA
jgi:hypothetical protein